MKNYLELTRMQDFIDRYRYLRLHGRVGIETFGSNRYLNQAFYSSSEWGRIRNEVIVRDGGCDLGVPGRELERGIIIHHIVPITYEDLIEANDLVIDLNNLICVSPATHRAIHYGDEQMLQLDFIPRRPFDTCPWKE